MDEPLHIDTETQARMCYSYWEDVRKKYNLNQEPSQLVSNYNRMFVEGWIAAWKAQSELSSGLMCWDDIMNKQN